jgi:hypothetical protein
MKILLSKEFDGVKKGTELEVIKKDANRFGKYYFKCKANNLLGVASIPYDFCEIVEL